MDDTDGVAGLLVALGNDVATAGADGDRHIERRTLLNRGDHGVGVHELELRRHVQVGAGHGCGTFDLEGRYRGVTGPVAREDEPLHVQNQIDHVLGHTRNGVELVLDALDADGRRRGAVERGEQHAAHAVAERVSVPALERLDYVAGKRIVDALDLHLGPHELCHCLASLASWSDYLE